MCGTPHRSRRTSTALSSPGNVDRAVDLRESLGASSRSVSARRRRVDGRERVARRSASRSRDDAPIDGERDDARDDASVDAISTRARCHGCLLDATRVTRVDWPRDQSGHSSACIRQGARRVAIERSDREQAG